MDVIERALERSLHDAAEAAPQPRHTFLDGIRDRQRRRRAQSRALVSAVASIAVLAVTVSALVGFNRPQRSAPIPPAAPTIDDTTTPPGVVMGPLGPDRTVAERWPRARIGLPDHLPDGRGAGYIAKLFDGSYVVQPLPSVGFPVVYNPTTNVVTKLVDIEPPELFPSHVGNTVTTVVGGGQVAMFAAGLRDGNPVAEVYLVPTTAGPAVQILTMPLPAGWFKPIGLSVTASWVYLELPDVAERPGGLYRMPRGGDLTQITGSDGWHLFEGAWLSNSRPLGLLGAIPPNGGDPIEFRNLETGERRTAVPTDGLRINSCGLQWCRSIRDGDGALYLQRLDGTKAAPFPFSPRNPLLVGGRFIIDYPPSAGPGSNGSWCYFWDPNRDVAATCSTAAAFAFVTEVQLINVDGAVIDLNSIF